MYLLQKHAAFNSFSKKFPSGIYRFIDDNDDDDDDDDDDESELFLLPGWLTKEVKTYFQTELFPRVLTIIVNLHQVVSRIWASAEPEFRLCWMKMCSSDIHYTTVPQCIAILFIFIFTIYYCYYFYNFIFLVN